MKYISIAFISLLSIINYSYSSTKQNQTGFDRIDKQLDSIMVQYKIPGVQLAIIHNEKIVYAKAYGYSDVEKRTPVTNFSTFRVASLSKPITLTSILKLFMDKGLSLDHKVFGKNGLLSFDYPLLDTAKLQKITVKHLIDHKAGFTNNLGDPMFWDKFISQDELIKRVLTERHIEFDPGEKYSYSNFGYCLLGRIIEVVSGATYADYVCHTILPLCDIQSMCIGGNEIADRKNDEVTYYGQESLSPYAMNIERMDAHGGWIGSASDLVKFLMAVDRNPQVDDILPKEWIENTYLSYERWIHTGSLPGTSAIISRFDDNWGYAILANTRTNGVLEAMESVVTSNLSIQ